MGRNFYFIEIANLKLLPIGKEIISVNVELLLSRFLCCFYLFPVYLGLYISSGGTEVAYVFGDFNRTGTLLASVGSSPDYMLTIWDWKQEETLLRSKAFAQDVYKVMFSAENEEHLTTGGSGHIR